MGIGDGLNVVGIGVGGIGMVGGIVKMWLGTYWRSSKCVAVFVELKLLFLSRVSGKVKVPSYRRFEPAHEITVLIT